MSTETAAITGVDFVTIPVRDLPAARAFYGDVLGLEPSVLYGPDEASAMGAEFETGTVTLSLFVMERAGQEHHATRAPLALHVDDFTGAKAALEARGVTFAADDIDSGVCHMAFFQDPDGNSLMLHHRYAPR